MLRPDDAWREGDAGGHARDPDAEFPNVFAENREWREVRLYEHARHTRDLPHAPSGEPVEWALAQDVLCCGDILVQFLHIPAMASKHKKMCSLWFHTSMVDGDGGGGGRARRDALVRAELDKAVKDKKHERFDLDSRRARARARVVVRPAAGLCTRPRACAGPPPSAASAPAGVRARCAARRPRRRPRTPYRARSPSSDQAPSPQLARRSRRRRNSHRERRTSTATGATDAGWRTRHVGLLRSARCERRRRRLRAGLAEHGRNLLSSVLG